MLSGVRGCEGGGEKLGLHGQNDKRRLGLTCTPGEGKQRHLGRLSRVVRGGAVAQLVERVVRNDEVRGSIPLSSTIIPKLEL